MSGKARSILIFMIALSAALVIGGAVWSVVEGIKGAKYGKATATVTACETQDLDGEEVVVKVLVAYEANGEKFDGASYIGDLNRCTVGMQMNVYYIKAAPSEYVYSKSSDLGFALILLCGGALWSGICAAYAVTMKKTGYLDR